MSRLDFLYRTELPHSAVAVYIYLADECWPAIPTIAADLKYSPSTVRRGIRDLKKAGLLETEQRYRKKGGKSSLLSGRYSARQIGPKPTALFLSAVVKA